MSPAALQIIAWLALLALLAVSWVLSQRWKHDDLRPLAAFLLFASVLALVMVAVFSALAWLLTLVMAGEVGTAATLVILVIAVLAGILAGRGIVRRPQRRQGPP